MRTNITRTAKHIAYVETSKDGKSLGLWNLRVGQGWGICARNLL